MGIKKLVGAFSCLFFCTPCLAYEFKSATEITLFKNYALSACVASHYEENTIYDDAIDSLNGNREYANLPLEAYYDLNEVLEEWSEKKYISKSGNISEFFMCVDFHNSKDIFEIFYKYNPCRDDENWPSKDEFEVRCKRLDM
ncbi:MAG: hypothetical protein COB94_005700 [Gammaproteobacteria bacterium]|nr:hypothetical protein [Gammaproteobacteria bacterium]